MAAVWYHQFQTLGDCFHLKIFFSQLHSVKAICISQILKETFAIQILPYSNCNFNCVSTGTSYLQIDLGDLWSFLWTNDRHCQGRFFKAIPGHSGGLSLQWQCRIQEYPKAHTCSFSEVQPHLEQTWLNWDVCPLGLKNSEHLTSPSCLDSILICCPTSSPSLPPAINLAITER